MNYKPKEFADMLGVTVRTLQRWDCSGKLKAYRTPTDRRYYTEEQYLLFKGIKPKDERKIVIYGRVSSQKQKEDLKNQVEFLRTYANARGIIVDEVISDIGSGLNYNRKNWNMLLDSVMSNDIKTIIIAHKDRFCRFGYEWFESFCNKFNTEIIVVNNENMSPEKEMIEDIISIIHVFSCRIYGLRKYKTQIKEDSTINNKGDTDAEVF